MNTIEIELRKIQDKNPEKIITAQEVVNLARDESSPLHAFFVWDDSKAANEFRLIQARRLLVRYRIVIDQELTIPSRVSLMSDRSMPGGGYRYTEDVLTNEDLKKELAKTALREFEGWKMRYSMIISVLKNETDKIEETLKTLGRDLTASDQKSPERTGNDVMGNVSRGLE